MKCFSVSGLTYCNSLEKRLPVSISAGLKQAVITAEVLGFLALHLMLAAKCNNLSMGFSTCWRIKQNNSHWTAYVSAPSSEEYVLFIGSQFTAYKLSKLKLAKGYRGALSP